MTNKYAEGYSGKRYYGGCQFVDTVEDLADSARESFLAAARQCAAEQRFTGGRVCLRP